MKIKNVTFLTIILFLSFVILRTSIPTPVYARTNLKIGATPNQKYRYKIKRAGENIYITYLNFFKNKSVGSYIGKLVSKRAAELTFIAENRMDTYLETSVSRYNTYVGFLNEHMEAGNVSKEEVLKTIGNNKEEFEKLRDMHPSQTTSWLLLQQAADSAEVISSKARE